jgi:hypothetical protein
MPVDSRNVFYKGPTALTGGSIEHRLVTADATLPSTPFSMEGASNVFAILNSHEFYVTALTGSNNDLAFIARANGSTPTITVTYVDPSANSAALSVEVDGSDITVNLATGSGGAITSTAAQIKAAIEADEDANALVAVVYPASNDGTGVVTAMSAVTLAGPTGTTPTLDVKLQHGAEGAGGTVVADHSAFAQKTGTAASEFKAFAAVGPIGQWYFDVGGTTPVFAVSLELIQR